MATKASISKILSEGMGITLLESKEFTNSFLECILNNSFKKRIKLNGFGTFYIHRAPQRLGRNPKTKESYIIGARKKLNFKASNKIKEILN
ncbi:HU family DNA-binding protein [Gammaproteobacteria bacterium]|jgi:nucleoid DNA-binding protein|nr:HU family DNA-binding protein [Gammaproteobacteria bacterium]